MFIKIKTISDSLLNPNPDGWDRIGSPKSKMAWSIKFKKSSILHKNYILFRFSIK